MKVSGPNPARNHSSTSIIFRCLIADCAECAAGGAPAGQTVPTKFNQGGEDIKLTSETTFAHDVRGVASLDYLSSFAFRLAFTDNFSQAVNSEVKSTAFVSKSYQGFSLNAFGSRYQNFQSSTNNDDTISIIHIPAVEFGSVDQRIPGTPLYGSYDFAAEGLRRTELNFSHPGRGGKIWRFSGTESANSFWGRLFRPSALLNDTFYTQQQQLRAVPGQATAQEEPVHNIFNRRAIGGSLDLRPHAGQGLWRRISGRGISSTPLSRELFIDTPTALKNSATLSVLIFVTS